MVGEATVLEDFEWQPQPKAAQFVQQLVTELQNRLPEMDSIANRLRTETGTRLFDWVDHLALREGRNIDGQLNGHGFLPEEMGDKTVWRHPRAIFPPICIADTDKEHLALKVESVMQFLHAHRARDNAVIEGGPTGQLQRVCFVGNETTELQVVERHGFDGFEIPFGEPDRVNCAMKNGDAFLQRKRNFGTDSEGFEHARQLVHKARSELGVDWACDLFFAGERSYWQSRNRAAQVQKARQDALGLGWANHDHHTYRSSREHFALLISVLEDLGFQCRERFYAGRDAGWGAQVLEQSTCGITIFADVDLRAEEVAGDFAHDGLEPQKELGTVGLWCKLHGEAFLQAGMHHLECQFDSDAARKQLAGEGINTMEPFTDFPYLKQAFTEGEIWQVSDQRIDTTLAGGFITSEQAERFRKSGSIGSHLEILQRDDGYKGFNQTGISEIIRETDPRRPQHYGS